MEKKELDAIGKDISKKAPGLVRGPIANAIQDLIDMDLNKDGTSDLLQAINLADEILPVLVAINEAVDFEVVADAIANAPGVRDKAKLSAALIKFGQLAEKAQKLTGK